MGYLVSREELQIERGVYQIKQISRESVFLLSWNGSCLALRSPLASRLISFKSAILSDRAHSNRSHPRTSFGYQLVSGSMW